MRAAANTFFVIIGSFLTLGAYLIQEPYLLVVGACMLGAGFRGIFD